MLAGAWPGQRMGHPLCPRVLGTWQIPLTKDAVAEARQHVSELARCVLQYSSQIDDVKLMTGELLANAHEHGGCDTAKIVVRANACTVLVEVHDQGTNFKQPSISDDPLAERGRGLFLVAAFATSWGIEHDSRGTKAWFQVRSP